MKKWKKRLGTVGIFASLFGVATASSYFIAANGLKKPAVQQESEPDKPGFLDRLLSSITGKSRIDIEANFSLSKGVDSLDLNLKGQVNNLIGEQITDIHLDEASLNSELQIDFNGARLNADFDYEQGKIFLAIPDKAYFYMPTNNILDVIDMIPTNNGALEAPSIFDNLDLEGLIATISQIELEDGVALTGGRGYYYTIKLALGDPELEENPLLKDGLNIHILTDINYNLIGLRSDRLIIDGAITFFNVSFKSYAEGEEKPEYTGHVSVTTPTLEVPEVNYLNRGENIYLPFAPALNIFDSLAKIVTKENFGANINFSLKQKSAAYNLISANIDLNANSKDKKFSIETHVAKQQEFDTAPLSFDPLIFYYLNDTIYAKFHKVAVSLETNTIAELINYATSQISDDMIAALLDSVSSMSGSLDLDEISSLPQKLFDTVGRITVSGNDAAAELGMKFNLAPFGVADLGDINVTIGYSASVKDGISYFRVDSNELSNMELHIQVSFVDYTDFSVNSDEYEELTPLVVLIKSGLNLIDNEEWGGKYRIELNGSIDDGDESTLDINIPKGDTSTKNPVKSSFIQFDLNKMLENKAFALKDLDMNGEIHLVDPDLYGHNIVIDKQPTNSNFLFAYNDALKGKFDSDVLSQMMELIMDVITNPDDHFLELFGDIIQRLNDSVLVQGINGNYALLLTYEYLSNVVIEKEYIEFDLSLDILNFGEKHVHIRVDNAYDHEATMESGSIVGARITKISISELEILGKTMNFEFNLKHYPSGEEFTASEQARLNPIEDYMDFSSIKLLLELGIHTSKFNYYELSADINATVYGLLGSKLFNIKVGTEIRIRNDHGDVDLDVFFMNIPVIPVFAGDADGYNGSSNRQAHICLHNGLFYIERTEKVSSGALWWKKDYDYKLQRVCTPQYFNDHIDTILLQDILNASSIVTSLIDNSGGATGDYQIEYEKILKYFGYYPEAKEFRFDLNLNTVVGNANLFNSTSLEIYEGVSKEDGVTGIFNKIKASLVLSFGLSIQIDFDINLDNYFVDIENGAHSIDYMTNPTTGIIARLSGLTVDNQSATIVAIER